MFFGYLKVSRACKKTVGILSPLVETSAGRLGSISDAAWQQPYMIGFLSMLISLIAQRETQDKLSSDQLGLVQLEAWSVITGQRGSGVGENICILSYDNNEAFEEGCENARRFLSALEGRPDPDDPGLAEIFMSGGGVSTAFPSGLTPQNQPFGEGGPVAARLWIRYFEQHIS